MPKEPTKGMSVDSVHGYAQKRISAGETLELRVSCPAEDPACDIVIYRLGPGGFYGGADIPMAWPVTHFDDVEQPQPIYPGSYVLVPDSITGDLSGLTIECWVRPWRAGGPRQGLVTQHDHPDQCSFGLFINPDGFVQFYHGAGGVFVDAQLHTSAEPLRLGKWAHLVGTWRPETKALYIDGILQGNWSEPGPAAGNGVPLRLGAHAKDGLTSYFLDGDLAMPALYDRALTECEILTRYADHGGTPPNGAEVLAAWPLAEEAGSIVDDASRHGRQGTIVNHATWMIGGPDFDSDSVQAFQTYDPAADPLRGHGLRLANDDLMDCEWQITDAVDVPLDAEPGIYAARMSSSAGKFLGDITFVLRRQPEEAARQLAVVCSSSTWLAYNAPPFAAHPEAQTGWGTGSRDIAVPGTPAISCYMPHLDGQPTYHCGMNVPWPMAQAHVQYEPPAGYGHLVGAELPLHSWLRDNGYNFDVLTDFDLHEDSHVLDGHAVVVVAGHSEYWSTEAQATLDEFLQAGGSVIVLSGNTMFWRVSFDAQMSVMECRKHALSGSTGAQVLGSFGDCYHSDDGRRGGLLRNSGHPGSEILGMEPAGYGGPFTPYTVMAADHFLFHVPNDLGVSKGDPLGLDPNGVANAVGHEWDVRAEMLGIAGSTPVDAPPMPAPPSGAVVLAASSGPTGAFWDYYGQDAPSRQVRSEMIYWELDTSGRIFYAGTIAYGRALSSDPRLATLLSNVLTYFGVP